MRPLGKLQYMEGRTIAPQIQDKYVSIVDLVWEHTAETKLKLVDYNANEAAAVTVSSK